jgi:hypothetical protein
MNIITSLYISKIEKSFNAEFIANVFDKNGIAKVSRVLLEPRKKFERYNKAYIEIKEWCNNETAFNFIMRLKNPMVEARIIYSDDYWWNVYINKFPKIILSRYQNHPTITIFRDNSTIVDDDISITAVTGTQTHYIDYKKTRQLKALIYGIKKADESIKQIYNK